MDELSTLLIERDGTLFLKVRASPGSSREGVRGLHGGALRVAVRAPPERGKANRAIRALLARVLRLRKNQIALESGSGSREKCFVIDGVSRAEIEERIRSLLETGLPDSRP